MVREKNHDEVVRIAEQQKSIGVPVIVLRLLNVVADLRDERNDEFDRGWDAAMEDRDIYESRYLTIRIPKFLWRKR